MSWTVPRTWVAGEVPTSSVMNAHLRDNLNALVWQEAEVITGEGTTSAAYTDLATAGPSVALTTTTAATVFIYAECLAVAGTTGRWSYEVSGATTIAASDTWCGGYTSNLAGGKLGTGRMSNQTLTAGSNTFKAKYKRAGGTGTPTFHRRKIIVLGVA